jgi:transposase
MAQAFHNACRDLLPQAKPVVDRFLVAKKFNEAIDGQRKKSPGHTRRSCRRPSARSSGPLLWEFRRDPRTLARQEKEKLEALFGKLPQLRTLYEFRLRFQRSLTRPRTAGRHTAC